VTVVAGDISTQTIAIITDTQFGGDNNHRRRPKRKR
jgi:cytoskeletal protein CcmA (bactofilin family)